MRNRLMLTAAFAATVPFMLTARVARGAVTAFWRANAITAQAIANDPALAGMQSWSVMVTNTQSDFISAGARAVLPAGSTFYRHPLGGIVRPTQAQIAANPALEFHTYVTSPQQAVGRSEPSWLGGFPDGQPHSMGGASDPIPGTFSLSWGQPQAVVWNIPPGTYEVMRATFPIGVLPQVHPQSVAYYLLPEEGALFPQIPEPAASLLLALLPFLRGRVASPREPR